MTETAVDVITKVTINTDLKLPTQYEVVYFNDNKTTSLFVAQSLIDVFGFTVLDAMNLTQKIDREGQGVAAAGLAKELASHLRDVVTMKAREENFPLVVEIREEGKN